MIYLLLSLLFVAHFLADFTQLSRPYMLAAKRFGTPILPIIEHGLVHAILMAVIVGFMTASLDEMISAFVIQLVAHSLIDIGKGRITASDEKYQNQSNISFWYLFGFDQLLHALTIIFIVYLINK